MAGRLLERQASRLFEDEAARGAFIREIEGGKAERPCLIWCASSGSPEALGLPGGGDLPEWAPDFVWPLAPESGAGRHRRHEAGDYYLLDFSSIFAASALLEATRGGHVLDVCAAPGGKSVFASRALSPEVLVSNEVIGKRLGMLRHNLARCRLPRVWTQRVDPAELGTAAGPGFDAVLVDAPCSGQSLLARGQANPGCFHPSVINGNAKRQRRILAGSADAVAPGGILVYATCTFATEENERVLRWFLGRRDDFEPVAVRHLDPWRSGLADFPCYRLYPQDGLGAGAFCGAMRRVGEGERCELGKEMLAYPVE